MASFYVIRGRDNGQHFAIRGVNATIGRDAMNQIQLRDTEVSRQHARIVRTNEFDFQIVDNRSSNGTFVNSRRVQSQVLKSGDRVQVGRTLLIFTGGPETYSTKATQPEQDSKAVEIVLEKDRDSLSQIRSSIVSQNLVSGPLRVESLLGAQPDDSKRNVSDLDAPDRDDLQPAANESASVETSPAVTPAATEMDEPRLIDSEIDKPSEDRNTARNSAAPAASDSNDLRRTVRMDELARTNDLSSLSVSPAAAIPLSSDEKTLEIVYRVSQAIHGTVDLNDLLTQVLDLIFQWIECDRGCVLMTDDASSRLRPIYSRDRKRSSKSKPIRISQTILEYVVDNKQGVLTSDAQDDSRWEQAESVTSLGVREAICVPMLGRYGLVGAIYVDTSTSAGIFAERLGNGAFNHEHLKLMLAIAGQAALAIEDTQFYHAMVQSERLAVMGQTIANLSHHVKNILQGISGGDYLVEEGLKNGDLNVVTKGWETVKRNQARISNLVMDMLSFSKERKPDFEERDVRTLIDEIVSFVQPQANVSQVLLVWQRPDSKIAAEFDAEAIHRALLNVVANAIDAFKNADETAPDDVRQDSPVAAKSQRIEISVTTDADFVTITVADNGQGIPEQQRERVFLPFESTKGARGTGLGLPVSQKTLREHGGDIILKSPSTGGSTFHLRWPIAQPKADRGRDGAPTQVN